MCTIVYDLGLIKWDSTILTCKFSTKHEVDAFIFIFFFEVSLILINSSSLQSDLQK